MRDPERRLPFLSAARGVFDLSLEGMVWSRRSLLMALLLGLPILFGVLFRAVLAAKMPPRLAGFDLFGLIVARYYVANVLPLAALFYASALVADEVEGKTITYLFSRPISRPAILAGKFASYLATTLALALPSTVITFFLVVTARGLRGVGGAVPDLFRDMGVIALTLAVYGAVFTLMGVLLRRPIVVGLLFLFGWELAANGPGYLPRLTVAGYLRSLVHHHPGGPGFAGLFQQVLPAPLCLATLAAVLAASLAASVWIFSRREYVLEQ